MRGLARLAAGLFWGWGLLSAGKGVFDLFEGAPEANVFSSAPWTFVTRDQWLRYGGFELAYGLACLGVGAACWVFGRRLPATTDRLIETT